MDKNAFIESLKGWSDEDLAEQLKNQNEMSESLWDESSYLSGSEYESAISEMNECDFCAQAIEAEIGRRIG